MENSRRLMGRVGLAWGTLALMTGCGNGSITGPEPFGTIDLSANGTGTCTGSKSAQIWTLKNRNGLIAKLTDFGATLVEMHVPDKMGTLVDVVQGFESVAGYAQSQFAGATVGRVGNRIADGTFTLDGTTTYTVTGAGPVGASPPTHSLHGGPCGWDKYVWTVTTAETSAGPQISFHLTSADGDMNFPGEVTAKSVYTLTNHNELKIVMKATTTAPTPINMLHHSYWNLRGAGAGTVYDQELTIYGDQYTPPAANGIPDGALTPVAGTPYDFTNAHLIGRDAAAPGVESEPGFPGYDHNWVVRGNPHKLRRVARYKDPVSGRVMTLEADQPGVQFYTTNYRPDPGLPGYVPTVGKDDKEYKVHQALALETQKHPNAINFPPSFIPGQEDEIIRPPETYTHTMIHRFTAE